MDQETVLKALKTVQEPDTDKDVVTLEMIRDLQITDHHVSFTLALQTPAFTPQRTLAKACESIVKNLPGVESVEISIAPHILGLSPQERKIPGIANIIAIASGKGGVGKSTVSVNLAIALAQAGARVGVMDADIYGPSIPQLIGLDQPPEVEDKKIIPTQKYGVHFMSFGLIMNEPLIWRGAMVHAVLQQLISEVRWGELDYLLVDLPPGTGDPPLTIAQLLSLSGVVIVTTPQHMALNIASKSLEMFRKPEIGAPILGLIENMSGFDCPDCGKHLEIFGQGQSETQAEALNVPFLGKIPLVTAIAAGGDTGEPILIQSPKSNQAQAIKQIAENLAKQTHKAVTSPKLRVLD